MSLFSRKPEKVVLSLSPSERRLAVHALMWWQNKLLRQGKPTEDVDDILGQADGLRRTLGEIRAFSIQICRKPLKNYRSRDIITENEFGGEIWLSSTINSSNC